MRNVEAHRRNAAGYRLDMAEGQVTINQTNIDVDVCILARCP